LDNSVYGTTGSYNSFANAAPKFASSPNTTYQTYSPTITEIKSPQTSTYSVKSPAGGTYASPKISTPKSPPLSSFSSSKFSSPSRQHYPPIPPPPPLNYPEYPDGFSSETSTNTYKIPGGYKTVTNKYESYSSSSQPMSYSATETYKITPGSHFTPISPTQKNGSSNYQTYSSEMQYKTHKSGDDPNLEQRSVQKSVTSHITEKKTMQTMKSTKQESSSKTFRLE